VYSLVIFLYIHANIYIKYGKREISVLGSKQSVESTVVAFSAAIPITAALDALLWFRSLAAPGLDARWKGLQPAGPATLQFPMAKAFLGNSLMRKISGRIRGADHHLVHE
jgi:hypothetical protein